VCAAADSSNAAEVAQAAIMQSQQKKLKHATQSSVLSAAPVLHRPAQPTMAVATAPEYTQYRELIEPPLLVKFIHQRQLIISFISFARGSFCVKIALFSLQFSSSLEFSLYFADSDINR